MAIRIGYAPGAYDLFHVGHLNILRQAKARCDFLVAGVVTDEICALTKGRLPVIPLPERMEIVRNISYVDEVYAERTTEKLDSWRDLGFTHLFKGDDWRGTPKGLKLESDFASVGVEIVYFPYTVHTSSSMLRRVLNATAGPDTDELAVISG
ncbi:glycerol-3-phosphate cytidylyltransferase [Nakamurella panacisegetis]|uniref:Glycerol-3-phosphate cytidylyltransferase n=1 Tax=Nakamurella panacisegetis TaxID=1090615 RepID=A0A1H0IIE4_9ACTN|nr:adenylyltransferase/cytidyltransferase family protein [Nakamurella panacisegetis]SDO31126.1 glycerol-3-phosphate cytidylyltransferase [Nakamurella panacisegetis]